MNRLSILLPVILLTGCMQATVPVAVKFPDVPKELLETCPDLKKVNPDGAKLSSVITVVTENYGQYYQCKVKVDTWIEWYNAQKNIHTNIK